MVTLALLLALADPALAGPAVEIRVQGGHSAPVRSFVLSPDGRLALSGDDEGIVSVLEIASLREVRTFDVHASVCSVAVSPDGALSAIRVWSLGAGGRVFVREVATGRETLRLGDDATDMADVPFSPDGASLVMFSRLDGEPTVQVWEAGPARDSTCAREVPARLRRAA